MQNKQGTIDHLRTHQSYPATRADLIKECNDLADFSDTDKAWFVTHLSEGSYNSADEVIKALGI
ncbi:hypothetical protein A3D78_01775 [Candidatus Gottesmanbacteria bacterium RIFCSPHIGHO2_02_FULL_39_14]|uniref:DUF2795 domain-containing protein n=2 Tax=Candidatus Gottesmaniibacteriota TaxID=1752720 RepID=A0A1F6A2H2_9BACT|nr:MAG: hypothetical protein A2153_06085 [Candidatus Gottesmanbacteria bacterium RBG_16_38_7b]OGG18527.1 MAG: hypothetical protein A3D78_01775 [Candidatus Gottesmanbacteria bacterium RIFCSPHIGHO2_02_FULL_39_14]